MPRLKIEKKEHIRVWSSPGYLTPFVLAIDQCFRLQYTMLLERAGGNIPFTLVQRQKEGLGGKLS